MSSPKTEDNENSDQLNTPKSFNTLNNIALKNPNPKFYGYQHQLSKKQR